jgi:hypothetical protein
MAKMVCPRCGTEFEREGHDFCPYTGYGFAIMLVGEEGKPDTDANVGHHPGEPMTTPLSESAMTPPVKQTTPPDLSPVTPQAPPPQAPPVTPAIGQLAYPPQATFAAPSPPPVPGRPQRLLPFIIGLLGLAVVVGTIRLAGSVFRVFKRKVAEPTSTVEPARKLDSRDLFIPPSEPFSG